VARNQLPTDCGPLPRLLYSVNEVAQMLHPEGPVMARDPRQRPIHIPGPGLADLVVNVVLGLTGGLIAVIGVIKIWNDGPWGPWVLALLVGFGVVRCWRVK